MIEYFNRDAEVLCPRYRFSGTTKNEFIKWKSALLAELRKLLGFMPHPVPLNPKIVYEIREDGIIKQRVLLDLEENMSVAALVYIPEVAMKNAAPAIFCSHGHGLYGKDSVMGIRGKNDPGRNREIESMNYDYGLQMAERGYVTMTIDWRGFGERSDGGNPYHDDRDICNVHFIRGSMMGKNLLALDIFDAQRCLDYLCELDYVDKQRIGAMGLSFGGTMTTWISLLDERIKAADIIGYSGCFKTFAIENGNFCGSQYVPGLFQLCDIPDLHGLIAPKPLLAEMGIHDKGLNVKDAIECGQKVKKIYEVAGAPQNYEVDLFDGEHQFAGNKAFSFFEKYLKGL